jgi:hypothetical protein
MDTRGRTPGKGHPLFQLLWPPKTEPVYLQTEVVPVIDRSDGEFIKYLAGFAHAGVPC